MAVKVTSKSGKVVTLLNPSEKGKKFAKEIKTGMKTTNDLIFLKIIWCMPQILMLSLTILMC